MKTSKKLMNLAVGTDSQMAQPQATFPLSHHETRCPDHRVISKGRVLLPLDRPVHSPSKCLWLPSPQTGLESRETLIPSLRNVRQHCQSCGCGFPGVGTTGRALSALSGIRLSGSRNGGSKDRALALAAPAPPPRLSHGSSFSAICDAKQLPHERAGERMYVLNAQQPLGVLGIDAAELGEHSHDLQEQEPAGQPEE